MKKALDDNIIKTSELTSEENWSDLEMFLGKMLENFSGDDIDNYLDAKEELEDLLIEYLHDQQDMIDIEKINNFAKALANCLFGFELDFPEEFKRRVSSIRSNYYGKINYMFITLNYTNVIDRILELVGNKGWLSKNHLNENSEQFSIGRALHVHGTLKEGMILGVNDKSQICNKSFHTELFLDSMIKTRMNSGTGYNREVQAKRIIDNSKIIYIYGASLGDSDNIWWEYLTDWLSRSTDNILVIYSFRNNSEEITRSSSKYQREKNKIIDDLLSRNNLMPHDKKDIIRRRIIVTFNNILSLE